MAVTTYLIYIIVVLTSVAVYFIRRRLNYWKEQGIPHDEPSLLKGNFQGIMKTRGFGEITSSTYHKFKGTGPFCGFYFFHRPGVLLLDKDLIKHVLIKDFSSFVNRGLYYNEVNDPLTGHLFFMDGQKWRSLRNKLSPTFTSGKMKFMFPTVVEVGERFVDAFDELLKNDDIVEIKELLARFSTDVIGSCAFGINCQSLKDPNAKFRLMGKRAITVPRHGPLGMAFIEGFPDLARKLGMRLIHNDVHTFFMGIVNETVAYREKENIKRKDFLNLLIDLNKGNIKSDEYGSLKGLSINEMAAQAFVFFLAGFETSSSTMSFLLHEIAQAQNIQDRMRNEILEVFERFNNEFTYECMQDLKYMKQVIHETLRKHPIVPHLNRQAMNDYSVPGNPKYVIRKGMPVIIPVLGVHHDPNIYPNPEVFDPERFSPEVEKERDPITWLPFGDGPRNCIGLRFGMMQMQVALTFLIKNFKFQTCPKTEIPLELDKKILVLNSKNGIYLKVERV